MNVLREERTAERLSSTLRGPRKGMKNCWKFRRGEEQPFPPPYFFPALHLINLASRSLCIGDFLRGGGGGVKKKKRNVSSRAPLNGTARTNCVIGSTRRQRHVYLYTYTHTHIYTTRGDVDLWAVSIIDPPVYQPRFCWQ